jgi:hypothetical protein
MKRIHLIPFILGLVTPLVAIGQTTIFQDTFGSSTLNPTAASPGTLNATTTAYQIASSKNASASGIAGNVFTLAQSASSSGYTEAQALFTAAPVSLATAGDYIKLYYTFTDTANVFNGNSGNGFSIGVGLFNSGGSAPTNGTLLWNTTGVNGLASTGTSAVNGGTKNWLGYNANVAYSASSGQGSTILTRGAQSGADNRNQGIGDGSGYSGNSTIKSLSGVVGQPTLTIGNIYTLAFTITYLGGVTNLINETLYNGAGTSGSIYSSGGFTASLSATNTPAQGLTDTFDGMVISLRGATSSGAPNIPISDITVIDSIQPVPEPSSVALAVLGGAGLLALLRRRS